MCSEFEVSVLRVPLDVLTAVAIDDVSGDWGSTTTALGNIAAECASLEIGLGDKLLGNKLVSDCLRCHSTFIYNYKPTLTK